MDKDGGKAKTRSELFSYVLSTHKKAEGGPQKSGARTRKHREKHKENGELPKPEEPGTGEMGGSEGLSGENAP